MTLEDRLMDFYFMNLKKKHPLIPEERLRQRAERLTQQELDAYDPQEDELRLLGLFRRAGV